MPAAHVLPLLLLLAAGAPLQRRAVESTSDHYRKWLEQDVAYVITVEERDVFRKLQTDEERDQFIEQFWARRDTDPSTAANEFKEEHYRRIKYANERFHAGIPGWKTDRGRVYIMFGEPDRMETHPAGGRYQRKPEEGGGTTSVYPFEIWEYRHIDGVGDEIELEFVNDAGGNLYRLTMDKQAKDELLRVPGMGFTDSELMAGGVKNPNRVRGIREAGLATGQGINYERAQDSPFERSALLMRISRPPAIRFTDLREVVTTSVSFNRFPFKLATELIQVTSTSFVVPVTLAFSNADVTFKNLEGLWHSQLQVYGRVSTLTKRTVFEFDDEIAADYTAGEIPAARRSAGAYQRKVVLAPGRYKLDLVVRDTGSGNTGTVSTGLEVPNRAEGRLAASSLVLSDDISPADGDLSRPFVLGLYKVRPRLDRALRAGDDFGFYVEAYNFAVDQSTRLPRLELRYGFAAPGAEPAAYRPITRGVTLDRDRIAVTRMLQLPQLAPGRYELVFAAHDTLTGQSTTARTPFEVK